MRAEIEGCQHALQAVGGRPVRWYRSVVGMTNPFVAPVLKALGLVRVGWSARGYDGVGCTLEGVLSRLLPDLRPGAIVLLHEGPPTATTGDHRTRAAGAGRAGAEGAAAGSVTPGPGGVEQPIMGSALQGVAIIL